MAINGNLWCWLVFKRPVRAARVGCTPALSMARPLVAAKARPRPWSALRSHVGRFLKKAVRHATQHWAPLAAAVKGHSDVHHRVSLPDAREGREVSRRQDALVRRHHVIVLYLLAAAVIAALVFHLVNVITKRVRATRAKLGATTLQCACRGRVARRSLAALRATRAMRAAIALQSARRSSAARQDFLALRAAALRAQANVRKLHAQQRLRQKLNAVARIQSAARARAHVRHLAAVTLQSAARCWMSSRAMRTIIAAAVVLQSGYRMWTASCAVHVALDARLIARGDFAPSKPRHRQGTKARPAAATSPRPTLRRRRQASHRLREAARKLDGATAAEASMLLTRVGRGLVARQKVTALRQQKTRRPAKGVDGRTDGRRRKPLAPLSINPRHLTFLSPSAPAPPSNRSDKENSGAAGAPAHAATTASQPLPSEIYAPQYDQLARLERLEATCAALLRHPQVPPPPPPPPLLALPPRAPPSPPRPPFCNAGPCAAAPPVESPSTKGRRAAVGAMMGELKERIRGRVPLKWDESPRTARLAMHAA